MSIIIPANSAVGGGFDAANGIRLDNNAYLNRTFSEAGAGGGGGTFKWTLSLWFKRSLIDGNEHVLMSRYVNANKYVTIKINGNNKIEYRVYNFSDQCRMTTTAILRDSAAWVNFVIAQDSTLGTAADRVKFFINGSRVTAFDTNTQIAQNVGGDFNTASPHQIAAYNGGDEFQGYMSQICFVDNAQYNADQFGEFDSDSGTWRAIDVSELSTGGTSFFLAFEDSSALGTDSSGESNNFSLNNITALDQTTDSCTNNFSIGNSLDNFFANAVFAEGNTKITTNSTAEAMNTGTIALSGGRWYYEIDIIDRGSTAQVGFTPHGSRVMSGISGKAGNVTPFAQAYKNDGKVDTGNGSGGQTTLASLSTYAAGDIIGVYLDLVDFKSYWSKNGSLQSSTGINITALNANSHDTGGGTGVYIPYVGDNSSGTPAVFEFNFGNPFQSQTSSVTDDNGFGKFEYSPNITGDGTAKSFFAICTKNLAATGG